MTKIGNIEIYSDKHVLQRNLKICQNGPYNCSFEKKCNKNGEKIKYVFGLKLFTRCQYVLLF